MLIDIFARIPRSEDAHPLVPLYIRFGAQDMINFFLLFCTFSFGLTDEERVAIIVASTGRYIFRHLLSANLSARHINLANLVASRL
jgi:hypothetical protein